MKILILFIIFIISSLTYISAAPNSITRSISMLLFNANDLTLSASDTIAVSSSSEFQRWRVQGDVGAITMSSTPFSGSLVDGAEIAIIGNDNTKTVEFTNNDIAGGCILTSPAILQKYFIITFIYNASLDRFIEKNRSF